MSKSKKTKNLPPIFYVIYFVIILVILYIALSEDSDVRLIYTGLLVITIFFGIVAMILSTSKKEKLPAISLSVEDESKGLPKEDYSNKYSFEVKEESESIREVISEEKIILTDIDPLFKKAAHLVVAYQCGYTSLIQRKLSIEYSRASDIMEQLEKADIVGPYINISPREVRVKDIESLEEILSKCTITYNQALSDIQEGGIIDWKEPSINEIELSSIDPLFEEAAKFVVKNWDAAVHLI